MITHPGHHNSHDHCHHHQRGIDEKTLPCHDYDEVAETELTTVTKAALLQLYIVHCTIRTLNVAQCVHCVTQ